MEALEAYLEDLNEEEFSTLAQNCALFMLWIEFAILWALDDLFSPKEDPDGKSLITLLVAPTLIGFALGYLYNKN